MSSYRSEPQGLDAAELQEGMESLDHLCMLKGKQQPGAPRSSPTLGSAHLLAHQWDFL